MVDVSCTAKPWDRSSRSMILRWPPGFGVWAQAFVARLVTATAAHKAAAIRKRIIVFPPCECVGTVLVLLVGEPRTWSGTSSDALGNIRGRQPRSQHTKPWQGPAKPWQGPGKPWQGPGEALRG